MSISKPNSSEHQDTAAGKTAAPAQTPTAAVAVSSPEKEARIVGEVLASAALASILDMPKTVTPAGVKVYVDNFLKDARQTADPLERVIIEQVVVVHHRLLLLHERAAKQKEALAASMYTDSASRLSAELRKLIETLKKHRAPVQTKSTVLHQVQHIGQQNIAAAGGQEVQYVDQGGGNSQMKTRDTKLEDREDREHANDRFRQQCEPSASHQRIGEPKEARALDA